MRIVLQCISYLTGKSHGSVFFFFFSPAHLCVLAVCWMWGCYLYQWCCERCRRRVFVCTGKAGLQLPPGQWVPQHWGEEGGGISWLIDWDAQHPRLPTPPPPCLLLAMQGAHVTRLPSSTLKERCTLEEGYVKTVTMTKIRCSALCKRVSNVGFSLFKSINTLVRTILYTSIYSSRHWINISKNPSLHTDWELLGYSTVFFDSFSDPPSGSWERRAVRGGGVCVWITGSFLGTSATTSQPASQPSSHSVWWMYAHARVRSCVRVCVYPQQHTPNTGSQHGVEAPTDTTAIPRLKAAASFGKPPRGQKHPRRLVTHRRTPRRIPACACRCNGAAACTDPRCYPTGGNQRLYMAVETIIWLFCLLSLFCAPSKQGKELSLELSACYCRLFLFFPPSACVGQHSTHISLQRSAVTQHKSSLR